MGTYTTHKVSASVAKAILHGRDEVAQKEGSRKKSRDHKESAGKHGGGGKVRLTRLEKVLIHGPRAFQPLGKGVKTKRFDRKKED